MKPKKSRPRLLIPSGSIDCIAVLGFCLLPELSRALRVSKEWLAAVRMMRSIDATIIHYAAARWPPPHYLSAPLLLRHIAAIEPPSSAYAPAGELTPNDVARFAQQAVNLRQLHWQVNFPSLSRPVVLPSKLRVLSLRLHSRFDGPVFNALLQTVSSLQSLESFSTCSEAIATSVTFSLLRAPSLRSFSLQTFGNLSLSLAQLDEFREPDFAGLEKLALIHLPSALFHLLRTPHNLRWKDIAPQLNFPVTVEDSACLASLSSTLTSLTVVARDASFLSPMAHLTSLQLTVARPCTSFGFTWTVPAPTVLSAFRCFQLTSLDLQAPFTSASMAALLARLPLLTTLRLSNMVDLESLVFFTQSEAAPAQRILRHLRIVGSRADLLQTHELVHLGSLKALVSLSLELPADLITSACQLLTVPSALLPRLERFEAQPYR